MKEKENIVKSRGQVFSEKYSTHIWKETPSENNPYISEKILCHGYDYFELIKKKKYSDVVFMLLNGEFPSPAQSSVLEKLMIASFNLGPRHFATRAAINAGVGRTRAENILPISLMVLSGKNNGIAEVELAMRFFKDNVSKPVSHVLDKIDFNDAAVSCSIPGFGRAFGGVDVVQKKLADIFLDEEFVGPAFQWGCDFCDKTESYNIGWLSSGLVAAILSDLGFSYKHGPLFYQFLCCPGFIAHGIEASKNPVTSVPFVSDENYFIRYGSERIEEKNEDE